MSTVVINLMNASKNLRVVMMLKIIIKILGLSLLIGYSSASSHLPNIPIKWRGGPIDLPCETTKKVYMEGVNRCINKNAIATRVAMYNDIAIVALPRYKPGIPITLARIQLKGETGNAVLTAFPSWDQQEEDNCDALQSVVDIFLDLHNILWVLDTGIVNSMVIPKRTCPPKVVGYDMESGYKVKSVDLHNLTTPSSRLQYIVADNSATGGIYFYITDADLGSIIVYNTQMNRGYRLLLPLICGEERDILFPILIRDKDGTNYILFSYLSSCGVFIVKTEHLQSGDVEGEIFHIGSKSRKVIFLGSDSGTGVFFRYEGEPNIYRWNALESFRTRNFELVYSSYDNNALATQVISDHNANKMRVLQSNFPDYLGETDYIDHSLITL